MSTKVFTIALAVSLALVGCKGQGYFEGADAFVASVVSQFTDPADANLSCEELLKAIAEANAIAELARESGSLSGREIKAAGLSNYWKSAAGLPEGRAENYQTIVQYRLDHLNKLYREKKC